MEVDDYMVIVVFSCDKNNDLWEPFYHCMEKYYPNHPKIIYKTEQIDNPYYETISKNYPMSEWTKGIRKTLDEIDDDLILFMADDMFIRKPVDKKRIDYTVEMIKQLPNAACFNYEKSFDSTDLTTNIEGFKKRNKGSLYEVSLMCGLWKKEALSKILSVDCSPWDIECNNNGYGYEFYINSEDFIIDWGYETWKHAGIKQGKWCREAKDFFDKEGIKIDYEKRGFASLEEIQL